MPTLSHPGGKTPLTSPKALNSSRNPEGIASKSAESGEILKTPQPPKSHPENAGINPATWERPSEQHEPAEIKQAPQPTECFCVVNKSANSRRIRVFPGMSLNRALSPLLIGPQMKRDEAAGIDLIEPSELSSPVSAVPFPKKKYVVMCLL